MSESETAATAQRNGSLVVRSAEPADHEAIGAYARYAGQLSATAVPRSSTAPNR